MEIGAGTLIRRIDGRKLVLKIEEQNEDQLNLCMYTHPHTETIPIDEFHSLGIKRLSILKALEVLKAKYGSEPKKYAEKFNEEIGKSMPDKVIAAERKQARRDDRISHFILRLAFCQSVEMSEWFIRQEAELFRMRFQMETTSNKLALLKANNIIPEEVTENVKQSIQYDLSHALTIPLEFLSKANIFKVDCWDVVELFALYRLLIKDGFAYISDNELIALVAPKFRENISLSLAHARRNIGVLQEEERLIPLMKHMVSGGIAYRKEFKDANSEDITPDMIDALARESFPLCMRTINYKLRIEHHLRHFARQQYGLFLKGIGLSMEGSLEFFRSEFTNKMDSEKFTKQYAYNIRHMYGQEGSRIEAKPLSCATIILGNAPTASDCNGCPFRHTEVAILKKKLESFGQFREDQITEMLTLSKMNRFDKACTKYFEAIHKIPELEELITHPNQYYAISRKIHRGEYQQTNTRPSNDMEQF